MEKNTITMRDGKLVYCASLVFPWQAWEVTPNPEHPDIDAPISDAVGRGGFGEPKMFLEVNAPHLLRAVEAEDRADRAEEEIALLKSKLDGLRKRSYIRVGSAFRKMMV